MTEFIFLVYEACIFCIESASNVLKFSKASTWVQDYFALPCQLQSDALLLKENMHASRQLGDTFQRSNMWWDTIYRGLQTSARDAHEILSLEAPHIAKIQIQSNYNQTELALST